MFSRDVNQFVVYKTTCGLPVVGLSVRLFLPLLFVLCMCVSVHHTCVCVDARAERRVRCGDWGVDWGRQTAAAPPQSHSTLADLRVVNAKAQTSDVTVRNLKDRKS